MAEGRDYAMSESGKFFYRLERVEVPRPKPGTVRMVRPALMNCKLCGTTISSSGGGADYLCSECGDDLVAGRLVGLVKRAAQT